MNRVLKRILGLTLALCLALSPVEVLAAQPETDTSGQETSAPETFPEDSTTVPETTETTPETTETDPPETTEETTEETTVETTEETEPESIPESVPETFPEDTLETEIVEFTAESTEETLEIAMMALAATDSPGFDEVIEDKGSHVEQRYLVDPDTDTWNTVYWTKGVTPPSMVGESSYRFHVVQDSGYTTIQAPFQAGNGYYDMNKTGNDPRCYLGAATNMIYWWLEQNRDNIRWFDQEVKKENSRFLQPEGLADLKTVDWDAYLTPPTATKTGALKTTKLDDSNLVNGPFATNYRVKENGYSADCVMDFFINGYKAIAVEDTPGQGAPLNTPGMYEMDPYGGFFYLIFGKDKLTTRSGTNQYAEASETFRQNICSGNGTTLSFKSNTVTHAVTLWGAEYDSDGNLVRVYMTDTDDFDNPGERGSEIARGLHSYNVLNHNGIMHFTNTDNPRPGEGGALSGYCTLSLGAAQWQKVREDTNAQPSAPLITDTDQNRAYNPDMPVDALKVHARLDENDAEQGSLSFQWYEADDETGSNPRAIAEATSWSYTPKPRKELGTYYYFCRVTTTKYGHTAHADSQVIALTVTEDEIHSAQAPFVSVKSPSGTHVKGYEGEKVIMTVEARADRGELSYQWYRFTSFGSNSKPQNVSPISGATTPTLEAAYGSYDYSATANQYFYCEVTNFDNDPSINGAKTGKTQSKAIRLQTLAPKEAQTPLVLTLEPAAPAYGDTVQASFTGGSGNGREAWNILGDAEDLGGGKFRVTGMGDIRILLTKAGDDTYRSAQAEITVHPVKAQSQVGTVSCTEKLTIQTDPATVTLTREGGTTEGSLKLAPGTTFREGTHSYDWVFTPTEGDFYEIAKGTIELTVTRDGKIPVTITAKGTNKPYDGHAQAGYEELTLEPAYAGTLQADYATQDGTPIAEAPRDAGSYQVTLSIQDPDYSGTSDPIDFTIEKRKVGIQSAEISPKTYDGKAAVPVLGVKFSNLDSEGILTDYHAEASFEDETAGINKKVTVTVTLGEKIKNYELTENTLILEGQEIQKAPVEGISVSVPTPQVGEKPLSQIIAGEYEAELVWSPNHETFQAGTAYSVEMRIRPDGNHVFAENITVNGKPAVWDDRKESLLVTETFEALHENRLILTDTALEGETTLWVDGVPLEVTTDESGAYVDLPQNSKVISVHQYNQADGDRHTQYPTNMQVYRIEYGENAPSARHLPKLDDLLTYRGMSIRLKGNRGIRMITGVNEPLKKELISTGIEGYQMVEYGTVIAWADNINENCPLVLGSDPELVKSNFAYRKGAADPIFARKGSEIQYTNVLVGFDLPKCVPDFAMRPYAVFHNEKTQDSFTVYGGILYRSIGYVAKQNGDKFPKGSPAYNFVWEIIDYVDKAQKP